jgi:hypothetical protein
LHIQGHGDGFWKADASQNHSCLSLGDMNARA